ncbi:MAG: hypothetical protein PUB17_08785 [Lachnospiraceae bacterium]|nr:hypothetical protein [Lachnospiraceae bacterium]
MRNFITWFGIIGKHLLKNPLIPVFIVLIPVICVVSTIFRKNDVQSAYRAGIYVDGNDYVSSELADALLKYDGSYEFIEYNDVDELYKDVKNSYLISGFIFPDDLSIKAADINCEDAILVIQQPSNSIQGSINEIVYSELIAIEGRTIITEHIESLGLFNMADTEYTDRLMAYYSRYLDSDVTFHLLYKTYGINGIQESNDSIGKITFPVRGILAVLVFLSALYGSVTYLKDIEYGSFAAVGGSRRILCRFIYPLIPSILFGIMTLISLGISGNSSGVWIEIPAMLMLIVLSSIFSAVFSLIVRRSRIFTACIPMLLLGSLIFCPVFINAGSYIPAARFAEKLFMPYYYLELFM